MKRQVKVLRNSDVRVLAAEERLSPLLIFELDGIRVLPVSRFGT